jgi:hypothetical protein
MPQISKKINRMRIRYKERSVESNNLEMCCFISSSFSKIIPLVELGLRSVFTYSYRWYFFTITKDNVTFV